MNFNFGEVLGRTWKIGWNHKVLWLWQMLPSAAIIFLLPSAFIYYPAFKRLIQDPELQIPIEPWMSNSLNLMGILFVLSYVLIWIFAQATTICGVIEIENGFVKISFMELLRKSIPYIWRIFGLYFLFGGMWALVSISFNLILGFAYKDISAVSDTLIPFLGLPLLPVYLLTIIVMELAKVAIVANNMRVLAAVVYAWKIFKSNLLRIIIMMVVLYFGIGFPFGLLLMPFPFLVGTSLLLLTRMPDPNVFLFILFFGFIPLVIILLTSLMGVYMTFLQSAWVVIYRRLTQNTNIPIISEEKPQEAGA